MILAHNAEHQWIWHPAASNLNWPKFFFGLKDFQKNRTRGKFHW